MNCWLTVRTGISDLELAFGFHSSLPVRSELVLIYENPMNSILADKVLKKTRLDSQKRFPIFRVCPKCLAAHLCGSAIRKNVSTSLPVLDEVGSTGNVGIVHCVLIQHLENLLNHSYN